MRGREIVFLLLVAGCGGATAETRDDTVRGRVIDDFEEPFPGVDVIVGEVATVTDEDGRFSVGDPGEHYDVVLRQHRRVFAYQGMSSREPVFELDLFAPETENGYVPIAVTFPEPGPGIETTLVAGVEGAVTSANLYSNGNDAVLREYSLMWMGDEDIDLVLYAFQYEVDSTGAPARYLGYDELRAPITSGEPFDWSVEWRPMVFETASLQATAVLPENYGIWSARLSMKTAGSRNWFWFLSASPEGSEISFLVPDVPGATFKLDVLTAGDGTSSGRSVSGLTTSSAPVEVLVEPGPTELDPPPEATGVDRNTRFSWVKGSDGVAFINVLPTGETSEELRYRITTSGTEFTLPDLSRLNEALPLATEYEWSAFVTTASSVDELAAHGTMVPNLPVSTYAYSGYQRFTTAN